MSIELQIAHAHLEANVASIRFSDAMEEGLLFLNTAPGDPRAAAARIAFNEAGDRMNAAIEACFDLMKAHPGETRAYLKSLEGT
tara:strand:+ start:237 stop:488 length:252 start_codon:yes stop_codon:yes gene_type:complete